MTALTQIAAARDPVFAARVLMICFKTAQNVASEDPGAVDHAVRVAYSNYIFRGAENPKLVAAHVIASNPSISATIESDPTLLGSNVPDGDIEFALATIWTARANAVAVV